MREEYATPENSTEKAREWLAAVDRHPRRRERFSFDHSYSTLLVLDVQRFFTDRDSHAYVPATRAILPNIQRLINAFRRVGRPVIFTRHALKDGEDAGIMSRMWRGVVREGTNEAMMAPPIAPRPSDAVLRKTKYSAFADTELEDRLKGSGTRSVVIAGVTTHLCCESTARDAFARDLEVYFVIDATASWTEDLHLSSLKVLSDGFAIPVTTDQIAAIGG